MEKNSTSKRLLNTPLYQPVLVYEINGDTLVPAIMGDKSYDYVDLFYSSYYHESWWFGHFSRDEKYKNLDEFKTNYLKDEFLALTNELNKLMSKDYCSISEPLLIEYQALEKANKEDIKNNKNNMDFYKKYEPYYRYLDHHLELSKLDIRFAYLMVDGEEYIKDGTTFRDMHSFEAKSHASYEEAKEFALKVRCRHCSHFAVAPFPDWQGDARRRTLPVAQLGRRITQAIHCRRRLRQRIPHDRQTDSGATKH